MRLHGVDGVQIRLRVPAFQAEHLARVVAAHFRVFFPHFARLHDVVVHGIGAFCVNVAEIEHRQRLVRRHTVLRFVFRVAVEHATVGGHGFLNNGFFLCFRRRQRHARLRARFQHFIAQFRRNRSLDRFPALFFHRHHQQIDFVGRGRFAVNVVNHADAVARILHTAAARKTDFDDFLAFTVGYDAHMGNFRGERADFRLFHFLRLTLLHAAPEFFNALGRLFGLFGFAFGFNFKRDVFAAFLVRRFLLVQTHAGQGALGRTAPAAVLRHIFAHARF